MSQTEAQHPAAEANFLATRFLNELADVIIDGAIVGSLRRQAAYVGEIDLLVVPIRPVDMLGEIDERSPTKLDARLRKWTSSNRPALQFGQDDAFCEVATLRRGDKNGPKQKTFTLTTWCNRRRQLSIAIDLYITTPDRWPVMLAIRTGPRDFSRSNGHRPLSRRTLAQRLLCE